MRGHGSIKDGLVRIHAHWKGQNTGQTDETTTMTDRNRITNEPRATPNIFLLTERLGKAIRRQ